MNLTYSQVPQGVLVYVVRKVNVATRELLGHLVQLELEDDQVPMV